MAAPVCSHLPPAVATSRKPENTLIDEKEPERGGCRNFIQEKNNVSDFNNDHGEGENNMTKKHLKLPSGNKLDAQLIEREMTRIRQ